MNRTDKRYIHTHNWKWYYNFHFLWAHAFFFFAIFFAWIIFCLAWLQPFPWHMLWLWNLKRFLPICPALWIDLTHARSYHSRNCAYRWQKKKRSVWNLSIKETCFNRKGRMLEPISFELLFQYSWLNRIIEFNNRTVTDCSMGLANSRWMES